MPNHANYALKMLYYAPKLSVVSTVYTNYSFLNGYY